MHVWHPSFGLAWSDTITAHASQHACMHASGVGCIFLELPLALAACTWWSLQAYGPAAAAVQRGAAGWTHLIHRVQVAVTLLLQLMRERLGLQGRGAVARKTNAQ